MTQSVQRSPTFYQSTSADFQTLRGLQIHSIMHRAIHLMVSMVKQLHPSLTPPIMPNVRAVKRVATGFYSNKDVFSVLMNHTSLFGHPMDDSVFTSCQEYGLTALS